MNIWAFGDSFIDIRPDRYPGQHKDQYIQIIARELGYNLHGFGKPGTSLDWVYKHVEDNRPLIKENDVIIIALTGLERRWFKEEYPGRSFWRNSPTNNAKENLAFKLYTLYLDYQEPFNYYLLNFLHNLNSLTEKLNLKTVILPAFNDTEEFLSYNKEKFSSIEIARGSLIEVMVNEYEPLFAYDRSFWPKEISEFECSYNHLLKSNHIILANKILEYIKNDVKIDLTEGFRQHLITREVYNDYEFCKFECFDYPLNTALPHPFPHLNDFIKSLKGPCY